MFRMSIVLAGLLLTQSLVASGNEASLKYGLTSIYNDDGTDFEKNTFVGSVLLDLYSSVLRPRFSFGYVGIDESVAEGGVDSLWQYSVDGIYDIPSNYPLSPYLFGGMGYEHVSNERDNFESHPYLEAGLGASYPINEDFNLVGEFRAMQIVGGSSAEDNEFALLVGISVPLGFDSLPQDGDGDGIFDSKDHCPNTPFGVQVDGFGCEIKTAELLSNMQIEPIQNEIQIQSEIQNPDLGVSVANNVPDVIDEEISMDSDGDGIANDLDRCPKTPLGAIVDSRGCAVKDRDCSVIKESVTTSTKIDSDHDGVVDSMDICPNTPRGFSVNAKGCPIKKTLDVNFGLDSYYVTEYSKPKIREFAKFLKQNPHLKTRIVGYTDNTGSYSMNQILSYKRASQIRELLISYGIDASRIKAVGKGSKNPVATNQTEKGRKKNRRIEAEVY